MYRLRKWANMGFDRATMDKYRLYIDKGNLKMVNRLSMYMVLLLIAVNVLLLAVNKLNPRDFGVMALSAALFVVIRLAGRAAVRAGDGAVLKRTCVLVALVKALVYLTAVYIGLFIGRSTISGAVLLAFVMAEVIFISPPSYTALVSLPAYGLFAVGVLLLEDRAIWVGELSYAFIALAMGFFLGKSMARQGVENIISRRRLMEINDSLYLSSMVDDLTGLDNRRRTFEKLEAMIDRATSESGFSCMILDVDDFKAFNDRYGHPEGDRLLGVIGQQLKRISDEYGVEVGRIGGEEFMVICRNFGPQEARALAVDIQEAVRTPLAGSSVTITLSVGLFTTGQIRSEEDVQQAYMLADKAMYTAKANGKNCVFEYSPEKSRFLPITRKSA